MIYGYHLIMLAVVFTVVAAFAAHTHRAAIYNLLNFYLAHPADGNPRLVASDLLSAAAGHPAHVRDFSAGHPVHPDFCRAAGMGSHHGLQRICLVAGAVRLAHLDA